MSNKLENLEYKLKKKLGFRNMQEKLKKNICVLIFSFNIYRCFSKWRTNNE